MNLYYDTVTRNVGGALKPYPGVSVAIYTAGTTDLVSMFEDDETTPKGNPIITDLNGAVRGKFAESSVDIVFSKNGSELDRLSGVSFGSTFDQSNVNITGGSINGTVIGNTNPANVTAVDLRHTGELLGGGA